MTEQPTRIRTKAEEALEGHFAGLAERRPDARHPRRAPSDAFMAHGLPHRRIEEWKYTDLRALDRGRAGAGRAGAPADAARAALKRADIFGSIDRARIVFVNGHFVPPLSDIEGLDDDVDFASLGRFLADGGAILDRSLDPAEAPIFALNSAFVRDGAVLRIRDGAKLKRPIEIVNLFAGDDAGPADAPPPDRGRRRRRRRRSCRPSPGRTASPTRPTS